MKNQYFAEIIESSLENWIAQSWQWDQFPIFGSVLIVENEKRKLFAIVHQIQTGSMDSSRQPFAYKKTEEELKKEQPQIYEFLRTTFSCLILGYQDNEDVFHALAPKPAKIHSFVRNATDQEISNFFRNSQYLQVLFGHGNKILNLDELLLALLKSIKQAKQFEQEQLDEFIETFSLLTCNDYRRLKLFLQRL
jgi:hypothetical protein